MAKKKTSVQDSPAASISEEEVESEEEFESEEEEEEEEVGGEDDEEEDSDDGSGEDEHDCSFPKPTKKTVSKPTKKIVVPDIAVSRKRTSESSQGNNEKKKKKTMEENSGGSSSQPEKLFPRLWSKNDEFVILTGMRDWHEKGKNPIVNIDEFIDYINRKVDADFVKKQLVEKIKKIKGKYKKHSMKGVGGKDPVFSNPHNTNCYQLWKVIWGASFNAKKKTRIREPKTTPALSDKEGSSSAYLRSTAAAFRNEKNFPIFGECLANKWLALFGDAKAKELEQKWENLHDAEAKLYLQRVELVQEQTASLINAIKSSD